MQKGILSGKVAIVFFACSLSFAGLAAAADTGDLVEQKTGTGIGSSSDKSYTDPVTGMEFVWVEDGCFQMGDTFGDGESDEKPVHEVCVAGFYIGKYEVTVGALRKFVEATGYRTEAEKGDGCYVKQGESWGKVSGKSWRDPNFRQGENEPVVCVSWNDSQIYMEWLNRQTGKQYRLPTEAEWEYASRSGGKREKYAGGDNVDAVAWYDSNSGSTTHPVGTKQANGLGIYDMSGNVWEWVNDRYGSDYYSQSPRDNPQGPSSGSDRVNRGGGCYGGPRFVRAAFRDWYSPGDRDGNLGFRLAVPAR